MIETITKTTSKGESIVSAMLHARAAKAGIPLSGNFELTARCNFGCKMCYVHQNRSSKEEMSAGEWIDMAQTAKERGMLFLLLTGGEPMIREDFPEIYTAIRNMGLMVSINTNGSLITDEILEMFRKNPPTRINISLYGGCNETYQKLCAVPAFDVVKENILRLKELGIPTKINCSVTPYNGQDVVKVYDFAKEAGINVNASAYMYPPVRINGEKYGEAPARFSAEEAARYMLLCREQYLSPEELGDMSLRFSEEEADCTGKAGLPMGCRAGRTSFWMTWDGRMIPCGMFPTDGYSVPKIGFDKAWEEVKKETEQIVMPAECTGCSKRERCGACAAACLAESGDTRIKPEYICRITHLRDELTRKKYGKGVELNENK